jgi:hypothetical protein
MKILMVETVECREVKEDVLQTGVGPISTVL